MVAKRRQRLVKPPDTPKPSHLSAELLHRRLESLERRDDMLGSRLGELEGTINWMRQMATLDKSVLQAARAFAHRVLGYIGDGTHPRDVEIVALANELLALTDR